MAIVQGIVDPGGAVIRAKGKFKVLSKANNLLRIEVMGQRTAKAIVLAAPWRNDGDIGAAAVSASPDPNAGDVMIFALEDYYGLSFRIEP